jgi:hypothetical protein
VSWPFYWQGDWIGLTSYQKDELKKQFRIWELEDKMSYSTQVLKQREEDFQKSIAKANMTAEEKEELLIDNIIEKLRPILRDMINTAISKIG